MSRSVSIPTSLPLAEMTGRAPTFWLLRILAAAATVSSRSTVTGFLLI